MAPDDGSAACALARLLVSLTPGHPHTRGVGHLGDKLGDAYLAPDLAGRPEDPAALAGERRGQDEGAGILDATGITRRADLEDGEIDHEERGVARVGVRARGNRHDDVARRRDRSGVEVGWALGRPGYSIGDRCAVAVPVGNPLVLAGADNAVVLRGEPLELARGGVAIVALPELRPLERDVLQLLRGGDIDGVVGVEEVPPEVRRA